MLAYKVETSPDTPALKTGQETYTWKEIEKASQIIADDLASLGVGRYKDLIIRGGENIMPADNEHGKP